MRKLGLLVGAIALVTAAPAARADERLPKTQETAQHGFAAECRRLGLGGDQCAAFDGRVVAPGLVDAYERSWVHYALTLQRGLDDGVPLLRTQWPHTHNTFNSSAYPATVTNQDPNQVYSITDQLRMEIRAIELDLHEMPGRDDVVLCHGTSVPIGPTSVEVGCSIDRPLRDGLAEFNAWLRAPQNRNEVVLLYLENQLNDHRAAAEQVVADIEASIGDVVYRPATHGAAPCAPMPTTISRRDIRAAGKRVLIVGNCTAGNWGAWVHERGPQWDESSSPMGDDYPEFSGCAAERRKAGYTTHFIRWYEDSTWLSTMLDGSTSQLTEVETRRMVRCGVNMIGFDQLTPTDPRLAALVWSWAPGWPHVDGSGGDCVASGSDGRWRTAPCSEHKRVACIAAAGDRFVSRRAVAWSQLATACGRGGRPDLPVNGYENELLKVAKSRDGTADVWLRYHRVRG